VTVWKDVVLKYKSCGVYSDQVEIFRASCSGSSIPVFVRSKEFSQTTLRADNTLVLTLASYFGPFLSEETFEAKGGQFCSVKDEKLVSYESFENLIISACAGSNCTGLFIPALIGFGGRFSTNDCSILSGFLGGVFTTPEQVSMDNYLVFRFTNATTKIEVFVDSEALIIRRILQTTVVASGINYAQYCYLNPVFEVTEQRIQKSLSEKFGASELQLHRLNASKVLPKSTRVSESQSQSRLLIIEPHNLLRAGLESVLSKDFLIDSCSDMDALSEQFFQSTYDLMIVNSKNLASSISANIAAIRSRYPNITIFIIGETFSLTSHYLEYQRLKVNAICLLDCKYTELAIALKEVEAGGIYIDPRLEEIMNKKPKQETKFKFTELEISVLRRIQMRERELCTELDLDRRKLSHIKESILSKLNAGSITRAGLMAEAMGYVQLPVIPELDPASGFSLEFKNAILAAQFELDHYEKF